MDKNELISIIEAAFDGVPQPEEITLHVAEAHDDYDYSHNACHRKSDFCGAWQSVPEEHLQKCQSALCYLEKIGLRFYLPAFMVWYLRNLGTDKVWTDSTLYAFDNYPNDNGLEMHHKERFSIFNTSQLRACALFVKYFSEDESGFGDQYFAQQKYERYWIKFI